MGAAASVRQLELFGDIHVHSSIPALGVAGIQCCAPQLACGRLDGHAGRFASATLWDADLQLSVYKLVLCMMQSHAETLAAVRCNHLWSAA